MQTKLFISEHSAKNDVQIPSTPRECLPKGSVLLHVLKSMEQEIVKREVLDGKNESFHPLWFLAETERNVFLWKSGCSLIQEDEFEFWIDLPRLVEKRLKQLEALDPENPFLNAGWSFTSPHPEFADKERYYLSELNEVLDAVSAHLHALSLVGSFVGDELNESSGKTRVLLPYLPRLSKKLDSE